MKIFIFSAFILAVFSSGISIAHIKKEEGWFYKYVRYNAASEKKLKQANVVQLFEKKHDGTTDSTVVLIHGTQIFNELVIAQSHQRPVVLKLFSPQSIDSLKVKSVYQDVAESLKNTASFVAMNILENHELFSQIMSLYQLNKVDLPLFLFYKDGQLYSPIHEPTPMVQGYLTKENLENFIKKKFAS